MDFGTSLRKTTDHPFRTDFRVLGDSLAAPNIHIPPKLPDQPTCRQGSQSVHLSYRLPILPSVWQAKLLGFNFSSPTFQVSMHDVIN